MAEYIKVAGVSVNRNSPPDKKDLILMALKTRMFFRLNKKEALFIIDEEIKKSGLYKRRKS